MSESDDSTAPFLVSRSEALGGIATPSPGPVPVLTRRRMLALSSAALVAPWVSQGILFSWASAAAQSLGTSATHLPDRWMSVGYLEGSERADDLAAQARHHLGQRGAPSSDPLLRRVVPAEALISGDPMLSNEVVTCRIHGLYPTLPPGQGGFGSARLTVLFPPPLDAMEPSLLPFFAWSFSDYPRNTGAPLSFRVPLGLDGSLPLLLEVTPAQSPTLALRRGSLGQTGLPGYPVPGRYHTDFTIDGIEARPKLQRGVYFLGLGSETWKRGRNLPAAEAAASPDLASIVISFEAGPEAEEAL